MVSMLSCLAFSMKPQVLITTTLWSLCSASWSTAMPLASSWAMSTSLSKVFLEQPRVTMFTLVGLRVRAFMRSVVLEQRVHERVPVEHLQVFDALAHPEVLDGDVELVADADGHAALGRAVDLGEGQRGDVGGLGELAGLFNGVLAGAGVEHEQHFVRCVGHHLAHHVAHLG